MIGTDKLKVNHISARRGTTFLKNQYPKQAKSIAYAPQPAPNCRRSVKAKIDVNFRNYRILGACNPKLAYEALQLEDKIGAMLPCNVVVQEVAGDQTEIAAVDPVASMQAIDNPRLKQAAEHVRALLQRASQAL